MRGGRCADFWTAVNSYPWRNGGRHSAEAGNAQIPILRGPVLSNSANGILEDLFQNR
jgi:hypothetical protein